MIFIIIEMNALRLVILLASLMQLYKAWPGGGRPNSRNGGSFGGGQDGVDQNENVKKRQGRIAQTESKTSKMVP